MTEKFYYVWDSTGWAEYLVTAKDKRSAVSKALIKMKKYCDDVFKEDLEAKLVKFDKDGVCDLGS